MAGKGESVLDLTWVFQDTAEKDIMRRQSSEAKIGFFGKRKEEREEERREGSLRQGRKERIKEGRGKKEGGKE